ncbi:MAG: FliA/WhiG family RNA polymerase sigma factor [Schwartzia sp.]|jgi:RNA polymerase sigma factor for flagellar operon FliA|nr:FliA/WhiG family RNA polymerase sigma factor [Schwartzia succinivorans]MBE6097055.1 FliA/WhiG family RNA polymerase sigma factor [Schwartzia succinivorans]MBQ1918585.1 FliA/WhiG family RNA polymerase sigma factor [Schwartzia sp. (in: firmicutes)]MBQ2048101.1 FliA/WhiG family RNA polymerase sigma factor [Schwartzia sp. (in: firmicutes)]
MKGGVVLGGLEELSTIDSLWLSYKKEHTKEVRDRLVEQYMNLVNIIAGRLAISLPPHVDRDDLISSGFFGLLDAVERYEPDRKNKFETYASVRIRGAMLDYLRSKDWVPTSVRAKIKKYENTVRELETSLGRNASDEEIADAMGITIDELNKTVSQMNVATIIPLDDYIRAETPNDGLESPGANIEKLEMQEILAKAIHRLPEREKQVVSLYYYEELTMKEISLVLHLSEARVCQLHTKAIFRLRGFLARNKENLVD